MASLLYFLILVSLSAVHGFAKYQPSFDENYRVTWGEDHITRKQNGREIDLSMDKSSGSGFGSKKNYGSGYFHFRMKLPDRDSAGVVTAFYLSSKTTSNHDELDFEFLGNREGKPYVLQTNVFTNGVGNREQRLHLWFDPTEDFHTYKILWNPFIIVFSVDNIPIRVFKNKKNIGVSYPSQPMQIIASLWDAEDWATDGGKTKTNRSYAPFKAYFRGFKVDGCEADSSNVHLCSSTNYWWNAYSYRDLTTTQELAYQKVKKNNIDYDYCTDKGRYPNVKEFKNLPQVAFGLYYPFYFIQLKVWLKQNMFKIT